MTTEQIALIGFLFIIAVLLWVVNRQGLTLATLVPSELVRDVAREAAKAALGYADTAAAKTETKADDELVALIRQELIKAGVILPDNPPLPPAEG